MKPIAEKENDTMRTFRLKKLVSLLLCVTLLTQLCPVPAHALADPSVTMTVTPSSESLGIGDYLIVTVNGQNTANTALQVVSPDSMQHFYYDFPATVPLTMEGIYFLIGYGTNTTDTTHPDFRRCMTGMEMFTVSGVSTAIPQCSMTVSVYNPDASAWSTLENKDLNAASLLFQLSLNSESAIPEDATLEVVLQDDRGVARTLYNAELWSIAEQKVEQNVICELSDHHTAADMMRENNYEQTFTLSALVHQNSLPLASASSTFILNSYTNEMRYVNRFYDDSMNPGVTPEGQKLVAWLDMGYRDVYTRTNSGYLMLEEEYEHQNTLGYKFGHGYVQTANALLDTISSLGLNWVGDIIENEKCKEKFPNAGKSAIVHYQMVLEFYAAYIEAVTLETFEMEQAAKDVKDLLGDPVDVINQATGDALEIFTSPDRDISTFIPRNMDAKKTPATIRVVDVKTHTISTGTGTIPGASTFLCSEPDGSGMIVEMSMHDILAQTADGRAVHLDSTALMEKYGFDASQAIIENDALITRIVDDAQLGSTAYSPSREHVCAETLQLSKAYHKLKPETRARIERYAGYLEKTTSVATFGISAVSYFQQREQLNAAQVVCFNMLATVTDEYLIMLDQWIRTAQSSSVKGREDIVDALNAVRSDIVATENELSSKIAQQKNVNVLSSGSYADAIVDGIDTITDLLGLKEFAAAKLGAAINWVMNRYNITMPKSFAAAKLPKGGMLVIQIGSIVLSMISAKYLAFHENVEAVYGLKKTLSDSLNAQMQQYRVNPSHQQAQAIIAGLNTLKVAKQIGENLINTYYLEDLYEDLELDSIADVRTLFWNELLMSSSNSLSPDMVKINAVYEDRESEIPVNKRHMYPIYQKTRWGKVLHGYYKLSPSAQVTYEGVELALIPEKFAKLTNNYKFMIASAKPRRIDSNASYGIPPQLVGEESGWRTGQETTIINPQYMYREIFYVYQHKNGIELLLSQTEYDAATHAISEINRILSSYSDSTAEIHWYDFEAKKEQQYQQRILWTRITNRYIESLKMYDPTITY